MRGRTWSALGIFFSVFFLVSGKSAMLSSGGLFRISKFDHGPEAAVVPRELARGDMRRYFGEIQGSFGVDLGCFGEFGERCGDRQVRSVG